MVDPSLSELSLSEPSWSELSWSQLSVIEHPGQRGPFPADPATLEVLSAQLGRPVRGVVDVAHRCPCGCPTVVRTLPRLPGGTPFPTTFYATCPRLTAAISTLESDGVMATMTQRLAEDADLLRAYQAAHEDYLARRAELAPPVPEIEGISAGGMPTRVKCLHVLAAHSLAAGPGVNPLGDETLAALPNWWEGGCCTPKEPEVDGAEVDGSDTDGSDTDGSGANDVHAEASGTHGLNADNSDSNGSDTGGSDSNGLDTGGSDSNGPDSNDLTAVVTTDMGLRGVGEPAGPRKGDKASHDRHDRHDRHDPHDRHVPHDPHDHHDQEGRG